MAHYRAMMFLLFVTLTFAASIVNSRNVSFATHNIHGFSKSSKYLKDCIHSYGGVWMIQEHWLSESKLQQLQQTDAQFVACSGMEDAVTRGIYCGRPHGGVSIAWSPEMDHAIKPLVNYRHKRIICIEMIAEPNPLTFASIYMPFYDSAKRQECMAE